MLRSSASATACSASAFARKKRARWWVEAPSTEKNTKRSTPWRCAARTIRQVAIPFSSSIEPRGWSRIEAARCTTVSTPRIALRNDGGSVEVAERDLHAHALGAQAPGIAHQAANLGPFGEQAPQQRGAHQAGRAGKQQHASYNMRLPEGSPRKPTQRKKRMAYVIAEPCIGTKDNSCVEVCPVDCIHPTPDEPGYDAAEMLYIDPEECIDCDACVEACPVDACFAEDQLPDEWQKFTQINADYFANAK